MPPAKPFINKPDTHEASGDEVFCIFHDERVCNAACAAFDIHGSQDDMRTPCILVNAQMQQSTSLVSIAKTLKSVVKDSVIPGSNLAPPGVK